MIGYPESITDPSYNGQILLQTYPLIGNYGVCPDFFESDGPKIEGYIVHELCRQPSHWSSKFSVDEWLVEKEIPGIEDLDTRMLTKKLRVHGVMLGLLWVYEGNDQPSSEELRKAVKRIPDPNKTDLVREVATARILRHEVHGSITVGLLDCGVKQNIIRSLNRRGMNVIQYPPDTPADRILADSPEGLVVSNGPGDPKMAGYAIETISELMDRRLPIFGICLGIQLLALAAGGNTYKLKFGHRGQNHPVIELANGSCYITSQNHGYAVETESLDKTGFELKFINANDKTVEGVKHRDLPIMAVQFHPEASPGPEDTGFLFDAFMEMLEKR